jgi:hypothetical protein
MKAIFFGIFFMICSVNVFGQILPNSQLDKIILIVESYLNNEISPYNEYSIVSIHEWNKIFHSGYSNVHRDFDILSYPYKEVFDLTESNENLIIISLSPDSNSIIVQIKYQNRYYGFHSKIIVANKRKYLQNIPYEIFEND